MKVLYPNVEPSYDCDILPCCECGDIMDENDSNTWFVCSANMDAHATAWEAGLLNRQCSEFIAFHIGGHFER
jgi:hypothetical protein